MRVLAISFVSFLPLVYSHGLVTSPKSRQAGPAMAMACGQQVENQQTSDDAGNVQGELQVAQSQKDYNPTACNLFLCKGFQFADNTANVQTFSPGQTVPITVDIRAPHTGTCNVSVVDTITNQIIGTPLILFSDYASNAHPIPPNNTQFSVTLPSSLPDSCSQPGNCVVQVSVRADALRLSI
jgi:predicted carbohydrate-binding protein with CBM5 and CBM33 domain